MSDEETTSIKVAGFDLKGWYLAAAVPVLSGISGAVYFGYDALSRFESVESAVEPLMGLESRVQTLEQAIQDNDVRGLASRLSGISTQMTTILEQQRQLLELRTQVERSTTITDGLGDRLDRYNQEIEDLWRAMDELAKPL